MMKQWKDRSLEDGLAILQANRPNTPALHEHTHFHGDDVYSVLLVQEHSRDA